MRTTSGPVRSGPCATRRRRRCRPTAPWAGPMRTMRNAACWRRGARALRDRHGFHPDIVIGHPGWERRCS
ncbi:hypothetical protein [Paracoccus marcusii]|uniref:hypothetical protein n=1 Tax=Paracoccus marcusii TaxID=59779 RepID=UPI0039C862FE